MDQRHEGSGAFPPRYGTDETTAALDEMRLILAGESELQVS